MASAGDEKQDERQQVDMAWQRKVGIELARLEAELGNAITVLLGEFEARTGLRPELPSLREQTMFGLQRVVMAEVEVRLRAPQKGRI